jgi:hypothetical protein
MLGSSPTTAMMRCARAAWFTIKNTPVPRSRQGIASKSVLFISFSFYVRYLRLGAYQGLKHWQVENTVTAETQAVKYSTY